MKTNTLLSPLLLTLAAALAATPQLAQAAAAPTTDTDGDGVPDAADPFPCDPSRSAVIFVPSEFGRGTLLFEDNWPARGDLDFNDAVVAYHLAIFQNASGLTSGLRLTVTPRAIGAKIENGLALRLPIPRGAASSIQRRLGTGAATPLSARTSDEDLVIQVSSNLRESFPSLSGFINTDAAVPSVGDGQSIVVDIAFGPGVYLDVTSDPFDLHFFRTGAPSHEVHRPQFGGTAAMDGSLFGTLDDGSLGVRRFVDTDGLPFVLTIPNAATWPRERTRIESVWPSIVSFARSGGADSTDFYSNAPALGTAFPADATGALESIDYAACVAPSCSDGLQNGDEQGPDCGGSCSASCARPRVTCQTAVLLHFDGDDGAANFVDETGKRVMATGAGHLVASPRRFGSAAYFDGTTDLELGSHPDFDFGDGDFTVEFWLQEVAPQTTYEGLMDLTGPDRLLVAVGNFMISPIYNDAYLQLNPNRFEHFAITREGSTIRAFRQGRLTYQRTYDGFVGSLSSVLHIGLNLNNGDFLTGYLDEFRIIKGTAMFTSNFSPEQAAYGVSARCSSDAQCSSGVCAGGCCIGAHCNDGLQNGEETDLDCGGAARGVGACEGCAPGLRCNTFLDCESGVCSNGICQATGDILNLHFDGAPGSTTYVDEVGRVVHHSGGGYITNARVRNGTGAGFFDGTTDLTVDIDQGFDMHELDFTVEFWFSELAPQTTYEGVLSFGGAHVYNQAVGIFLISPLYNDPYLDLADDTWEHFAIVRSGGTLTGYRNGQQIWQRSQTGQVGDATGEVHIGFNYNNGDYMTGYMDDLRITKGVARYTAPFNP